jgi:hypothetical protein
MGMNRELVEQPKLSEHAIDRQYNDHKAAQREREHNDANEESQQAELKPAKFWLGSHFIRLRRLYFMALDECFLCSVKYPMCRRSCTRYCRCIQFSLWSPVIASISQTPCFYFGLLPSCKQFVAEQKS